MKLDSAVLYTNNIQKVVDFYHGILGLNIDYREGDKFVQFKFENEVGLAVKKQIEDREIPGSQTIFLASDDIERDYKKLKEAGVEFRKKLSTESWGKQFSIFDPDKNKVEFIQRKQT
jgi:predicted enzyme related to lactoylglutathione lyase